MSSWFKHTDDDGKETEKAQLDELEELHRLLRKFEEFVVRNDIRDKHIERLLNEILAELRPTPRLTSVKLVFTPTPPVLTNDMTILGGAMPTPGPITLIVGQKTKATVTGFDQTGAPMPAAFVMPPATYAISDPLRDSGVSDGSNGLDITSLAADPNATSPVAISVQLTSTEGLQLSDSSTITNVAAKPPAPVLTSVKLQFSTPA